MVENPKNIDRRIVLVGGVAAGSLGISSAFAQAGSNTNSVQPAFSVIVTLNGATYTYPNGPKIPFYYVGFRQDGRVVFHLGALGDLNKSGSTVKPYHFGAHHVRIENSGKILFDADIPMHWWNSQWTYRPRPLAVARTPAQIVAAHRMFIFGDTGQKVGAPHNYA